MEKRNKVKSYSLKLKIPVEENLKKRENLIQELQTFYEKLKERDSNLDKEIVELVAQGIDTDLKPQMEALHHYNEMKDVTQMVLGYLADIDNTSVSELHKLYNLPLD